MMISLFEREKKIVEKEDHHFPLFTQSFSFTDFSLTGDWVHP